MNDTWFQRHQPRLDAAVAASASRTYFSAFGESVTPWDHPAEVSRAGTAAFRAWLDADFPIETPGSEGTVSTERSPYGFDLGVRYPRVVD
ncbi:phenylacetic acid degradation protein PaaN, partial [Nocardioides hankookensis]